MTDHAFITMLAVLGTVWGGFILLLVHALRQEAGKSSSKSPD